MLTAAGFPRATGIAATNQRIYLGSATDIWRLDNILEPNQIEGRRHDRLFVPRQAHVSGDINIHELCVEASGRLIFTATSHSCLATLGAGNGFHPLWQPKFISQLVPEDRCHLNGLAIEDGRVRYVTACSASDSRAGWHAQRSAAGVLIDVVTDELIAEGLLLPHSPRVAGDAIYVLESGRAALVRLDRGSGRREDVMLCPGIARGLAFTGDYALLTISVLRDSDSGMHPLISRCGDAWQRLGAGCW